MSADPAAGRAAVHPTVFDDDAPELARVYSEALLNAAQGGGDVDAVLEDLEAVRTDVLDQVPELGEMLVSPTRTAADNDRVLTAALEGRVHPTVVRFLRVLNRHGRLGLLGPVTRAARAAWDRRSGRRAVTVRSAVPLAADQADALRDRLAATLHATPVLTFEVDPSLIGGLVVQVGDDVYDASVRDRLEQLRNRLTQGKSHEVSSRRDHLRYSE